MELSYLFIAVIGMGFFTFYDIFDINVAFVQTCVPIRFGCTATIAAGCSFLKLVVLVGTLTLSPASDRIRRVTC